MIKKIIDLIALEWLRRRIQQLAKVGAFEYTIDEHPIILMVANEFAMIMDKMKATNGLTIGFHSGPAQRDIVFDVRWADGKTVMERLLEVGAELKLGEEKTAKYKASIEDLFDTIDWPDSGSIDGFEFEQWAEKHGYIVARTVHEPCGEDCICQGVADDRDFEAGMECFQKVI